MICLKYMHLGYAPCSPCARAYISGKSLVPMLLHFVPSCSSGISLVPTTCNSCNTGMRALPDMYAQLPEGRRPEGRGRTYQAKPECPVLQLICNTYQADSLYRAINHPSPYECSHWIYYICISNFLIMGQQLVHCGYVHGYDERTYPRDITNNFGYASLMF